MEMSFGMSLRIIFLFLSVGSPHVFMHWSLADTISSPSSSSSSSVESEFLHPHFPNDRTLVRREIFPPDNSNDGEENKSSMSNGEETDEELIKTRPVLAGPTKYPMDYGGSSSSNYYFKHKRMSFRQAVVLAREEAKCLSEFGSQMQKTEMDLLATNKAHAQRLVIPFGCFQSETSAQCEQCKNITAQPPSTLDECQHSFCIASDKACNDTCLNIYDALNSPDKADDTVPFFHNDNTTNTINKLPNNSNTAAGVKSFAMEGTTVGRLIQSVGVFCEGVNASAEDSKRDNRSGSFHESPNDLDGSHFVILKWTIKETRTQHSLQSSSSSLSPNENRIPTNGIYNENVTPHDQMSIENGGSRKKENAFIYVVEQKSGNSTDWVTIGKTPYGLQKVNVFYHSNSYQWRITAVGPNGIEDVAKTDDYVTLNGYKRPGPPKKIYVVETKVRNSSIDVLIGWEPPDEKACFYKIVLKKPSGEKTETVRIRDEPLGLHMTWFENLSFGTTYDVLMTSRDPSWDRGFESNLLNLEFTTPTCLESFNYRFDKCDPPPPTDIRAEVEEIVGRGEQQTTDQQLKVTLLWNPPLNTSDQNRIEKYVVGVSTFNLLQMPNLPKLISPLESLLPQNYTVPGNTSKLLLTNLKPDTEYNVMITAYSAYRRSPTAQFHFNTKIGVKAELSQEAVGNWIYVTITFTVAVVLLLMCNVIRIYIHKRNVKIARTKYFRSMEERDEMGADWSIVPLTEDSFNLKLFDENFPKEKWEISWDDLTMGEVIGQGAFGVVRRAKMPKVKLETKLKFRGEDETWFNSADRMVDETDPDMEMVAVKMVKVSSTRDDKEQLMKEITMMQSLGFHSQIVGLLGACTKGRNLCLVLEYCPGGDLLTFVRKVRAKYWPTLGLAGSNNSPLNANKRGITAGMKFCGRTNSGSGSGGHHSGFSSISANRKSFDSSPINYADIGGFSASCSSPEDSSPGFQDGENSKKDFGGNGNSIVSDANSIPPFFAHGSQQEFEDDDEFRPIDEKDVLSYARQIAMGMEYLEKNRVVHRDLACRNVLLMGDYKHVKISDFGLSRDIYTWNVYHQKSNGKLPIKWMAIESIFTHIFTTKSDVWSYGILLWELVTLGGTPYPGLGNTELFHLLKSGYRMERPDNCSEELYAVMKKCWRTAAASRPSFTELRRHVETMMEAAEPNLYLSLMADLPADYFQLSSRSDIPLVGKDDGLVTPLKDSPVGGSSMSMFNNSRHSRNYSSREISGTGAPSSGSDYFGSTKRSRNNGVSSSSSNTYASSSRRKPQSLYHNTSFSHHHSNHHQSNYHQQNQRLLQSQDDEPLDSSNFEGNSRLMEQYDDDDESGTDGPANTERRQHKGYRSKNGNSVSLVNSPEMMMANNPSLVSSTYSVMSGGDGPGNEERSPTAETFPPQTNQQPNSRSSLTRHSSTASSSGSSSFHSGRSGNGIKRNLQRFPSNCSTKLERGSANKSGGENEGQQQLEGNLEMSSERRSSLQSPDSGILIQKGGNNADSEHEASITGELEACEEEDDDKESQNQHVEGDDESRSPSADSTSKRRNLEVNWRESGGGARDGAPVTSSMQPQSSSSMSSCRSPSRSSSFSKHEQQLSSHRNKQSLTHHHHSSQSQRRPKLTLPFVNVNDMTIIENRTYDLRDIN